ncbi:hypothetical protein B566_EDAN006056 [Ephemera danica]|nr:hypothetical protein B566_EDAN006056 [Ephemera danica]
MGQRCDFAMYEKTNVSAELRACDRDVMHLCVTKLETPMGVIPQSVLRTGQRCDFAMYEKTNVSAELRACDRDVMHLCVTKLETPMGVIPQSVLRTGDILSIHVPELPKIPR